MPEITIRSRNLRLADLPLLSDKETLYTFDPRSLLDECLGKHRYIVSCENQLTNSLAGQHIAVNQYAVKHTDPSRNKLLTVAISEDPRISLYKRLANTAIPAAIKRLFVAVPHPEADSLACQKGWDINYPYSDFLAYNNKISQKERLGDLTPAWAIIDPASDNLESSEAYYIKRAIGAGGFATFHTSDLTGMKQAIQAYPSKWYKEKAIEGAPRSVQLFRNGPKDYTLFGYSEMKIRFQKNYAGGLMKKINNLPDYLNENLACALFRLDPLFGDYTGFLGLDFIEADKKMFILEANVRTTMATFATLQLNESHREELEFFHFQ
ncbi:MAG: ATP-grasp domain-containing protein [Bacteroidota bacterium]|nr:ATP-grasp domain-containing protein [Bacteroidota bacterium]